MNNFEILKKLRVELKAGIDRKIKKDNQRFFKEKILCYGVRTPLVRRLSKKYFQEIKGLGKVRIFKLCEELLKNKYNEEATVAIQWATEFKKDFTEKDFAIFENWLKRYIDNWGKDDDFCFHLVQPLIKKYPELVEKVKAWSRSKNIWLRRASAVSFISTSGAFYTTNHSLRDIFEVADSLLEDPEDLVQKGYGWMLKSASVKHQKEVFDFLKKRKKQLPRVALRYAIEKMPERLRREIMK